MKTRLFIAAVAVIMPLHATTHSVLPGNSIQAKIDIAVAGDIVAIFGGTYNEDLTINKAIRLVEVSGQDVTLTGSILFTGVTACPPLEGFNVGSAGRGITLTNTTGMVLRNLVGLTSSGVAAGGSSTLEIVDCNLTDINMGGTSTLMLWNTSINNLTAGGTKAEVWNATVRGGINQTTGTLHTTSISVAGNFDTGDGAQKTVAFRITVVGDNNWRSKKSWFGYGKARSFNFYGTACKVVFTASEINRMGYWEVGINLKGSNNQYLISNSHIHNITQNRDNLNQGNAIELQGASNRAVIQNNYFNLNREDWFYSDGIDIFDSAVVIIRNNIMDGSDWFAEAPFGVIMQNNHVVNGQDYVRVRGGVIPENFSWGDPGFVDGNPYKLAAGSPCINAGTADPRYNDRDGTRNDIGPSGGAWFDPDGWTTENPVVISFDLTPDQVLEGVGTEVILSEGQAVSAP